MKRSFLLLLAATSLGACGRADTKPQTDAALTITASTSASTPEPAPAPPAAFPVNDSFARATASDTELAAHGMNAFGADVYAKLATAGGNLVFSPASIALALGMTEAGARGDTAKDGGIVRRRPSVPLLPARHEERGDPLRGPHRRSPLSPPTRQARRLHLLVVRPANRGAPRSSFDEPCTDRRRIRCGIPLRSRDLVLDDDGPPGSEAREDRSALNPRESRKPCSVAWT